MKNQKWTESNSKYNWIDWTNYNKSVQFDLKIYLKFLMLKTWIEVTFTTNFKQPYKNYEKIFTKKIFITKSFNSKSQSLK